MVVDTYELAPSHCCCGWFLSFFMCPNQEWHRGCKKAHWTGQRWVRCRATTVFLTLYSFCIHSLGLVLRFASNPFHVCCDLVFEDLVSFTNFSGIRFCRAGRESMLWGSTTARVWTDTLAKILIKQFIHAAPRQGPPAPRSQGVISASVVVAPG